MSELLVHDGVLAAAARDGGKTAITFEGRAVSYRDLADQVRRLSGALQVRLGLPRGARVLLLLPNCPEFYVSVLAVAHAGLVSVPVPAGATDREIRHIAGHSGSVAVLADAGVAVRVGSVLGELEDGGVPVLTWSAARRSGPAVEELIASGSSGTIARPVGERSAFFFGYTSGTTGVPKAAVVSHRARTAMALMYAQEYGCYGSGDTALVTTPLYHGAGLSRGLTPLMTGGSVVLHRRFDPSAVLDALAAPGITAAFMVPTMFAAIFDLPGREVSRLRDRALTILSNASALPDPIKQRILGAWPRVRLFEIYGSTEAGTVASLRPEDQRRKSRCVGQPLALTDARLLGADGADVAPGEVGELVSRSPFVFDGYHGDDEATAGAFHDGWVGVGDLARRDEDGYLYIVGRKSEVIITGGVNVYPREVEEVLAAHPGVREAAVFGVPDERWGERVCAAVVPAAGFDLDVASLDEHCRSLLSPAKVPRSVRILAEMPRTSSGKAAKLELARQAQIPKTTTTRRADAGR
ncbi:MAG TPA: class I adenylate-forming enzyme family protein [Streptosporangiaceae bacterium]|nr:class I adenylate-forming enzyme family protein [Streptosporangiaceae bacterium]